MAKIYKVKLNVVNKTIEPREEIVKADSPTQAKGYLSFESEKIGLEKIIEDKESDKEMVQLAKKELFIFLNKKFGALSDIF